MSTTSAMTLTKAPTGIDGVDAILNGGLPRGRPSLVCGTAGCGKTLFGLEFLVRGATEYSEPGLFVAFEENADELRQNVASLGHDLSALEAQGLLYIDSIQIERHEIEEVGEYDLEGLFIRLGMLIDQIGARRVVLDTLEALFAAFPSQAILRAELHRLFRWFKERDLTVVVTAERGDGTLTRHGIEEYVADCVILLDHRIIEQISTRRLRVVKYRGSLHGTNEYPFVIGEHGLSMLPISSLGLEHHASEERVSTGIAQLDEMFGGQGIYRGSSVLITGEAGTGKTSLALTFLAAACGRGERGLAFCFEESPSQVMRNMRAIGLDLRPWVANGLLQFASVRPTFHGLETHLMSMLDAVRRFTPQVVVIDPITAFGPVGSLLDITAMLARLLDNFKSEQITTLCTSLTDTDGSVERSEINISSLVSTWVLLRNLEANGERNRGLYVLKARGIAHSNQIRELLISDQGLRLAEVYTGTGSVLTGTARMAAEANERAEELHRRQEIARRQQDIARQRLALAAQIDSLQAEVGALDISAQQMTEREVSQEQSDRTMRAALEHRRMADRSKGWPEAPTYGGAGDE